MKICPKVSKFRVFSWFSGIRLALGVTHALFIHFLLRFYAFILSSDSGEPKLPGDYCGDKPTDAAAFFYIARWPYCEFEKSYAG